MKNRSTGRLGGFTLIELLIVVLIIGILTAVALPKYQSAVDKSRYATLMPTAKTIANSQEAFYMANGNYAEDLSNLETQVTKDASGSTAQLPDGTKLEISQRESHKYVKMSKDNLDNNYIVYQAQSPNYAKEIHCEALKDSTRAERLCETLGGEKINGYLTPGYDTYVLEGTGLGMSADVADKIDQAGNGGWQACDTYPCTKTCNRPIASGYTCEGTYQEDGSYTERSCQGDICVEKKYGEDGKMESKRTCLLKGNICSTKTESFYDEDGNKTSERKCYYWKSDGTCEASGYIDGNDYTYDENGNQNSSHYCPSYTTNGTCSKDYSGGYEYAYDDNGNKTAERHCKEVGAGGKCTSYDYGYEYTYDENGNKTSQRSCDEYGADGQCTKYRSTGYEYTYDENGKQTSSRQCTSYNSDGSCGQYNREFTYEYEYDEKGNQTAARQCYDFSSSGKCISYSGGSEYTYDDNGNKTSARQCRTFKSDGSCRQYYGGTADREFTYDENGNMTSQRTCSTSGYDASIGGCSGYSSSIEYTYDEDGNKTSERRCTRFDGTTCLNWDSRQFPYK